jgi:hypothetical protein
MKLFLKLEIKHWEEIICKMEGQDSNLIRKLGWANNPEGFSSKVPFLDICKALEDEGYGLLADKNNPDRLDETNSVFSVVLPDNTIISGRDIDNYLEQRNGTYSSTNKEDIKMHKVYMYYTSFIASHSH